MSAAQHVENFLQLLTAGILTGVIYGLMCVGLSMIFGIMRVINFAQGEFMMLGMYLAWYCFGFLAGFTFFPELIAPYVAAACPDRRQFVATHSVFMTLIHGLKLVVFGALGFSLGTYLPLIIAMIATAFLGTMFGRGVLNRLPEHVFRRIFQVVLTLLALRLLFTGVSNLKISP